MAKPFTLENPFCTEVQFRRWADSSTQGPTATFGFADRAVIDVLVSNEGKRFALTLIEILPDESLASDGSKPAEKKPDERGPLCKEAIELARNEAFQEFIQSVAGYRPGEVSGRAYILAHCSIESRKELDQSEHKAALFADLRRQFQVWVRGRA